MNEKRQLTTDAQPRLFYVRTFGCQMNVHDSERIAGQLVAAGYRETSQAETADVIVINTCAVRENADNRLYGNLGQLRPLKERNPALRIAVGGCLAQKDQAKIVERAPWVDAVFGTHNPQALPVLLRRAEVTGESQVEIAAAAASFPSDLPTKRSSAYSAWVAISVGCNNTCTFCIVPSLRGPERDRRPGEVLAEIEALVGQGVVEVTLLGQNVNSYGVQFGDKSAFAKLLRACGDIEGLLRVRFTSPHPRDFTDEVIEAMADTPNVMPHLHMPLQSGSDSVLARMRRSYRSRRFLDLVERVRNRIPGVAITTDIIVGFPGETEADFQDTLNVVNEARFDGAFTFQYSPRPGTPAASFPDQVDRLTVTNRYQELVQLIDRIVLEQAARLVGTEVELLVSETAGKKDGRTQRLSGRSAANRLVHFTAGGVEPRPGDLVRSVITYAAPHHLVSDREPVAVIATVGGDAWQAREEAASVAVAKSVAVAPNVDAGPDTGCASGCSATATATATATKRPVPLPLPLLLRAPTI